MLGTTLRNRLHPEFIGKKNLHGRLNWAEVYTDHLGARFRTVFSSSMKERRSHYLPPPQGVRPLQLKLETRNGLELLFCPVPWLTLTVVDGPDTRSGANIQNPLGVFVFGRKTQLFVQGETEEVVLQVYVCQSQ